MLHRLPLVLERVSSIRARLGELTEAPQPAPTRPFGEALARADTSAEPGEGHPRAAAVGDLVHAAALRHGIDPDLIHAVIRAESDYDPYCRSHAGAMGLMQLMPGTAQALGVTDAWDPAQNVDGGARYLRQQLDRFGDLRLALAAYNAGPGAVSRYGGVPPYDETRTYVERVIRFLSERQAGGSQTP